MITAGKQHNVIPETAEACVDIRMSPLCDLKEIETKINNFITTESGVTWKYHIKFDSTTVSSIQSDDQYFSSIEKTLKDHNIQFETKIFPGGTDSRFYRSIGIPSYGISPFSNTTLLLHDHNEYLNSQIFLKGIEFYSKLIENVCNCD